MRAYLVTGAAGFIGGALANKLIENGNNVVTIDNLSTGFREAIPEGVKFIKGNCQNEKVINKLKSYKFEAIFHIAGQSSGEISFDDPVYDLQTNTQSVLLLLKYAIETGCKNFIYASSMSVYGDQPDKPVIESAITRTKSFYGVGKIASEHYMRIYSQWGINSTALRLFNVYGPGQNMENMRQGMVSIFLSQALKNQYILVKGSAKRYRDFVYIDDVVDAFLKTLFRNDSPGFKVYNISTGIKKTVGDLIDIIKQNLPFDVTIEFSGSTAGDQFGIVGNPHKAFKELGWKAKTPLDSGIKKMIDYEIKIK